MFCNTRPNVTFVGAVIPREEFLAARAVMVVSSSAHGKLLASPLRLPLSRSGKAYGMSRGFHLMRRCSVKAEERRAGRSLVDRSDQPLEIVLFGKPLEGARADRPAVILIHPVFS